MVEPSFTLRGATPVTLQHHDTLRLLWKMTFQDIRGTVIYILGSNKGHLPTSPNCACHATEDSRIWHKSMETLKRHVQCGPDQRMIRPWTRQSATRSATEDTLRAHHAHRVWKSTTCDALAIILNFTKYYACNKQWTSPNITPATKTEWAIWMQLDQILRLPRKFNAQLDCNFIKNCACHKKCASLWDSTSLLRHDSLPL